MNTLVSNIGVSGILIALDIAKKHHDAKIRHPDGRTSYLRIENTLEGFNRLLALTASPHEDIIAAFEPTADYHRNIAWWLQKAMTDVVTKVARVAHAIVKQDIDYKGYYEISHGT